jgi:hypothetical protein
LPRQMKKLGGRDSVQFWGWGRWRWRRQRKEHWRRIPGIVLFLWLCRM